MFAPPSDANDPVYSGFLKKALADFVEKGGRKRLKEIRAYTEPRLPPLTPDNSGNRLSKEEEVLDDMS